MLVADDSPHSLKVLIPPKLFVLQRTTDMNETLLAMKYLTVNNFACIIAKKTNTGSWIQVTVSI